MSHYDEGVRLLHELKINVDHQFRWHEQTNITEIQRQEQLNSFFRVVHHTIGKYLIEQEKKAR